MRRRRAVVGSRGPVAPGGRALLVAAHGVADLGQVAGAGRGHDGRLVAAVAHLHAGRRPSLKLRPSSLQAGLEGLVQRGHAVVVEARGHGAEHRHLLGGHVSRLLGCAALAWPHRAGRRCAPLRSNLLMATNSAKSSMSIFSSWLAAPNSGVITYMGTSTCGTMAASPWPMPEVSTTIRSNPAHLVAATTSGRAALISLPKSRVASERMNTRWPFCQGEIAFMRMRSPSKAPPLLRREGSIEITAMRSAVALVQADATHQFIGERGFARAACAGDAEHGHFVAAAACWRTASTMAASALPFSSAVMSWASLRASSFRRGLEWRGALGARTG